MQLVARHGEHHAALTKLRDLVHVGETVAAVERPTVDDHPLEDVQLHVGKDMLHGPDLLAVAVEDGGTLLEDGVGGGRAEILHTREINGRSTPTTHEIHTFRGDKICKVEVYFGWDLPA